MNWGFVHHVVIKKKQHLCGLKNNNNTATDPVDVLRCVGNVGTMTSAFTFPGLSGYPFLGWVEQEAQSNFNCLCYVLYISNN